MIQTIIDIVNSDKSSPTALFQSILLRY